jgi:uncharacterized repeat protein (TIGR01451 family)
MKASYTKRIFTFFILLVLIGGHFASFGQDVILETQADVDAFDPMITAINGNLQIGFANGQLSNITNTSNLSNITSVDGYVQIKNNKDLINIDGLSNLTTIGEYLDISVNTNLMNIDGLSNLTTIGEHLIILFNKELINIDGLNSLSIIETYLYISANGNLINIDGLSNLTTIGEHLDLTNNDNLINLDGLSSLATIPTYLIVRGNDNLKNVNGLSNITSVGGYIILSNNLNLFDCCGIQDLLENKATSIGGNITIEDNPFGCNSEQEILVSSCELSLTFSLISPCVNVQNGSIQVYIEGYTTIPFNYEWLRQEDGLTGNGISESDDFIIDMLGSGTYNLTVTNTTPDTVIKNDIVLSQEDGFIFEIIELTTTNSSNSQNNGSISVISVGGTGPYSYSWSGVSSGTVSEIVENFYTIPNLGYGEYIITIEDNAEASKVVTVSLLDEEVQVIPCEEPLDIVILNDVSGSVDATEYMESKQFFVEFLSAVNIGLGVNESRSAMIEWSSSDEQQIKIPFTGDLTTLTSYTNATRSFFGGTSPHEAMSFGENYLKTNARPDAEKVLIISTDGSSGQISSSLIALADEYKANGYHIISIAFDNAFSDINTRDILRQIASVDALAPGASAYSQLDANLAQTIVNNYLCPIDPGSSATAYFNRDGAIDITEINPIGNCPYPDYVEVTVDISAHRELSIPAGTYVTFYHNNPNQSGATQILTWQIPCAIPVDSKETYTITLPMDGPSNIFAVLNDDGTQGPPVNFPITAIEEIAYSNNIDSERVCLDQNATIQALKYSALPIPACDTLVNYTINVCNISEVDAFGVTVEDVPPSDFVLTGVVFNDTGCAIDNGGTFDLPADCCFSLFLTYDAAGAENGYYGDQDVILGGPTNQTYFDFDGGTTTDEDVTIDGSIDCPSTNISFTKSVNVDESCDDGFVEFTFTITNEMNIPLQGLTFQDILPDPCTWAYVPYGENGLSIGNPNVIGESAIFTIDEVQANTVATFYMDASLNYWSNDGTLNNTATIGNVPDVVNGGFKILTSNTTSTEITASPKITIPDTIIVNTSIDSVDLEAVLSTFAEVEWTTEGDGLFTEANNENTVYVLGANDIMNGQVNLFISAISECNKTGASLLILFADCSDDEDLEIQLNADHLGCGDDQVEIMVTSNFALDSILWSGPSNEGLVGDNLLISLPGEYTLIGYSGVCPDTVSIIVDEASEQVVLFESYTICVGEEILINNEVYTTAGSYQQTLISISDCDTILNIELEVLENGMGEETYIIHSGEILLINGIEYDGQGQYMQDLVASNGCDSILIINIREDESWITFDFDDCSASIQTMGNADYSEFTPYYGNEPNCGSVTSSNIYREDPFVNKHSCTDGLNDSYSMCISSDSNCDFDKNSTKMVRMDIEINPNPNSEIVITGIEFFQQAPETFDWINGDDGENNYPTKFGVRILKGGVEIYHSENNPTALTWKKEAFSFIDNDDFIFTESTTLEIQLLSYCPIGVNSPVTAWDLEDLHVFGACSEENGSMNVIAGSISPYSNSILDDVLITLSVDDKVKNIMTDENGNYAVMENPMNSQVNIKAYKNDDLLKGVSTLDLVKIQRHILELELFENPLQYIAADIDNDGKLSPNDLLQLRKLILGIYAELPSNTSYKFLDKEEVYVPNISPWGISEDINIPNLNAHTFDADFIPVKIGDVTNYGQYQSNTDAALFELEEPILVTEGIIEEESKTTINFDLSQPESINGYQYQINIKDSKLIGVESKLDDFNEDNYNVTDDGMLIISWTNAEDNGIVSSNLFTLHFDEKFHENLLEEEILSEVYVNNKRHRLKSIKSGSFKYMSHISNLLIYPNPVNNQTIISFEQNAKSVVDFSILNLEGEVMFKENLTTTEGKNSFLFPMHELESQSGLFIVRLTNNGNSIFEKIVMAH